MTAREDGIMKKSRIIALFCLLLVGYGIDAKSIKDLLVSMPDSIVPLLNKNLRTELVELHEMKVKAEVNNLLGETSVMDTITRNFFQIRLDAACTLQVKMLPAAEGDSLLCMVRTFSAPEKDSEVMLFDQQWRTLDTSRLFGGKGLADVQESLMQKPDTMSEQRFRELKTMVEPRMMSAILFEHDNSIVFRLSLPLLSEEEKKQVNAIKVQRKFNWNGECFNEG